MDRARGRRERASDSDRRWTWRSRALRSGAGERRRPQCQSERASALHGKTLPLAAELGGGLRGNSFHLGAARAPRVRLAVGAGRCARSRRFQARVGAVDAFGRSGNCSLLRNRERLANGDVVHRPVARSRRDRRLCRGAEARTAAGRGADPHAHRASSRDGVAVDIDVLQLWSPPVLR